MVEPKEKNQAYKQIQWNDKISIEDFIRLAYANILERIPNEEEINYHMGVLNAHNLPRNYIYKVLINSGEYEKLLNPIHFARLQVIPYSSPKQM